MSRPYPIIYLPRLSDHELLIRGLYACGYRYAAYGDVESGLTAWKQSMGEDAKSVLYPWVSLKDGGRVVGHIRRDYVSASNTPVNSVGHFLRYARTLRAQGSGA